MEVSRRMAEVRRRVRGWRAAGERVALVPTMGNLHDGHIRLMELARRHADRVVASIFVNPTQFGPQEDYTRYPRTPEADGTRLAQAGVDLLYAPDVADLYPFGVEAATVVTVPGLSEVLCGAARPGHFQGVTSVVCRLFTAVTPDTAVFGRKDLQQLVLVRRMTADLHLPVEILAAETVREADGLAMSSRNQYLSGEERGRAPELFRMLGDLRAAIVAGAEDYESLQQQGCEQLQRSGFRPDYVAIRNADNLALPQRGERPLAVLAAAWLGRARLIDNVTVL